MLENLHSNQIEEDSLPSNNQKQNCAFLRTEVSVDWLEAIHCHCYVYIISAIADIGLGICNNSKYAASSSGVVSSELTFIFDNWTFLNCPPQLALGYFLCNGRLWFWGKDWLVKRVSDTSPNTGLAKSFLDTFFFWILIFFSFLAWVLKFIPLLL